VERLLKAHFGDALGASLVVDFGIGERSCVIPMAHGKGGKPKRKKPKAGGG
jgi:hypothetical protein